MPRKLAVTLMKWENVECQLKTTESGATEAEVWVNGLAVPECVGYTVSVPPRSILTLTLNLEGEAEDLLTVVAALGGLLEIK